MSLRNANPGPLSWGGLPRVLSREQRDGRGPDISPTSTDHLLTNTPSQKDHKRGVNGHKFKHSR